MRYSVIIPVYNAEKTIRRCLESLLSQGRDDVELLVINDGSSDGSGTVCREYAARYSCVRYFEKSNGGVASARNFGLKRATGTYILFVDDDDYVSERYFATLDMHVDASCDLLIFESIKFRGDVYSAGKGWAGKSAQPRRTAKILACALRRQRLNAVWNKVFSRDMLQKNGILFDERLSIGEDKVFVLCYAAYSQSVKIIPEPLYYFSLENPDSLSRRRRADLCGHVLLEHQLLLENAAASPFSGIYLKAVSYSFYRSAYTVICELYKFDHTTAQRREKIEEICGRFRQMKVASFSGLRHRLIALPIRQKWVSVIDIVMQIKRRL